ncbi:MAG: hypothetical protein AAGN15_16740 [Cyanobacteria bacterium J06581_3]
MGVLGESSVVLIPAVHKPFGAVTESSLLQSSSLFRGFGASPPERIGLQGEYDYNGLARRVEQCFGESVTEGIGQLKVRQRGCVVILTGRVSSRPLLTRLVNLAIKVEGAALVEIYRMRFDDEDFDGEEGFAA